MSDDPMNAPVGVENFAPDPATKFMLMAERAFRERDHARAEIERLTVELEASFRSAGIMAERILEQDDEIEWLTAALHQISEWSRAYPLKVFPEPDFAKAAELLQAGGMTIDAISASNMRHVIEGVGKIAQAALDHQPPSTPGRE